MENKELITTKEKPLLLSIAVSIMVSISVSIMFILASKLLGL